AGVSSAGLGDQRPGDIIAVSPAVLDGVRGRQPFARAVDQQACEQARCHGAGGLPPIHMPFFLEAAILSRIRSPVSSRSNCAKDSKTLRVRRPIDVVVLNCCVTDTKETPAASKISTIFAKSANDRVSRSTL